MSSRNAARWSAWTTGLLLTAFVALGLLLRLRDPLATPAIGAEDPYTHIVFTKESLERGFFGDSMWLGTSLYPPAIHALLGILAPLSGVSLYDFARIAPPLIGTLAIVGMYALGARLAGPVAGLTAALLTAVMPEIVFRSTLFFPTMLDLAILPAYLLAFHLAIRWDPDDARVPWRIPQRVGAAALFLVMSIAFAFLHPWAVPLFGVPLAIYAGLRVLRSGEPRLALPRVAWAAALSVLSMAWAMANRWTQSDTGFADFFGQLPMLAWLARLELSPFPLFLVLIAVLSAFAAVAVGVVALAARGNAMLPGRARLGIAIASAALALVALPFLVREPPIGVNYTRMLGSVPIALAVVGAAIGLARPSALGDLGIALALVLLPLTAINVFDSEFWPARTVAYLAIGAALLGAATVAAAHDLMANRASVTRSLPRAAAAPLALMLPLVVVGGAMAAVPPEQDDWYRLYDEAEFEGLQETTRIIDETGSRVIVYSWQPAVVLRSIVDMDRVRYSPSFFQDEAKRDKVLEEKSYPQYAVVEKHALEAHEDGEADLGFLEDESAWRLVLWSDDGRWRVYEEVDQE